MRKHSVLTASIFSLLGLLSAALRYVHIKYGYDAGGLPVKGGLATVLVVIPLAIAVIALVVAIGTALSSDTKSTFPGCMSPKRFGGAYLLSQFAVAALFLIAGITSFIADTSTNVILKIILIVLSVLSAISIVFMGLCAYKGRQTKVAGNLGIIPSAYLCANLIVIFARNVVNAVLLVYSFDCVALAAATLFVFSIAGYALHKKQLFTTLFTGLITVSFSFIAIVGQQSETPQILLYLGCIVYSLTNIICFTQNLVKTDNKPKSKYISTEH